MCVGMCVCVDMCVYVHTCAHGGPVHAIAQMWKSEMSLWELGPPFYYVGTGKQAHRRAISGTCKRARGPHAAHALLRLPM